jgi:hypothetical protein
VLLVNAPAGKLIVIEPSGNEKVPPSAPIVFFIASPIVAPFMVFAGIKVSWSGFFADFLQEGKLKISSNNKQRLPELLIFIFNGLFYTNRAIMDWSIK